MQETFVEEKPVQPPQTEQQAFFTDPRPVKRKRLRDVIVFQLCTSAGICLLIKLSEMLSQPLYENILLYFRRLFLW